LNKTIFKKPIEFKWLYDQAFRDRRTQTIYYSLSANNQLPQLANDFVFKKCSKKWFFILEKKASSIRFHGNQAFPQR